MLQDEISGWREDLFTPRKSALNLLGVLSMSKVGIPEKKCLQLLFTKFSMYICLIACRGLLLRLHFHQNARKVKRTNEKIAVPWGSC